MLNRLACFPGSPDGLRQYGWRQSQEDIDRPRTDELTAFWQTRALDSVACHVTGGNRCTVLVPLDAAAEGDS